MNADGVIDFCTRLGLSFSQPYNSGRRGIHISISCPLALAGNHADPHDGNRSCSVRLDDAEPSVVRCWGGSCNFKGSFARLAEQSLKSRDLLQKDEWREYLKTIKGIESLDPEVMLARVTSKQAGGTVMLGGNHSLFAKNKSDEHVLPESELNDFEKDYHPYAKARGISREAFQKWGLCYDARAERLVFPIRRQGGDLVGLSGRDVTDKHKTDTTRPKYRNYRGFDKTLFVYGEHLWQRGRDLIFVEGQIDTVLTEQAVGKRFNVGGLLGTGFQQAQIRKCVETGPKRFLLFPDGDVPGYSIMDKVFTALKKSLIPCYLIRPPLGKDPADLDVEDLQLSVASAEMLLDGVLDEFR